MPKHTRPEMAASVPLPRVFIDFDIQTSKEINKIAFKAENKNMPIAEKNGGNQVEEFP
ncbi:hypothetical protein GCM10011390_49830 [Aureimonas endophytica]|uniref:Uncharacterized protein n=1 Tax=Aureimonas endophytica TaxID=2027858 RepID=A0A917A3E5_9HYPH|nr:hypothetical protein GCM10011390_49830 [Aureimonas endophytica]